VFPYYVCIVIAFAFGEIYSSSSSSSSVRHSIEMSPLGFVDIRVSDIGCCTRQQTTLRILWYVTMLKGLFITYGPAFRHVSVEPFENIEIYNLLARK